MIWHDPNGSLRHGAVVDLHLSSWSPSPSAVTMRCLSSTLASGVHALAEHLRCGLRCGESRSSQRPGREHCSHRFSWRAPRVGRVHQRHLTADSMVAAHRASAEPSDRQARYAITPGIGATKRLRIVVTSMVTTCAVLRRRRGRCAAVASPILVPLAQRLHLQPRQVLARQ
jgi:hypothetical protein